MITKDYEVFRGILRDAGYTGQINEAQRAYLVAAGESDAQLMEMWWSYLTAQGYTQPTLPEKMAAFIAANAGGGGGSWGPDNDVDFPSGSYGTSGAGYASKGNIFTANADMRITEINYRVNLDPGAGNFDVVAAKMSGVTASDTITVISRTTDVTAVTTGTSADNTVVLDTPLELTSGDDFYIGLLRTDAGASSAVGLYTLSGSYAADPNFTWVTSGRFVDDDLIVGDSPNDVLAIEWSLAYTYQLAV